MTLEKMEKTMTIGLSYPDGVIANLQEEEERLRALLFQVANDTRCFHLHERTKKLLREFQLVDR